MPKLNDTQPLLLAHAAKRDDGSFYPLSTTANGAAARATKAIATLIKLGYAEERETTDMAIVSRSDGDFRYGAFITPAGLAVIGIEDGPPRPRFLRSIGSRFFRMRHSTSVRSRRLKSASKRQP